MEANQYQKLYRSLSNSGGEVRKAGDWDEFFEPAYYSPVFPGDIPSEIPEFTTSELGIDHPMDTFNKEVPQYFVLVIDNVDEFENGEVFVDTQGYEYVRYGYGIKKPEPIEEVKQTMEGKDKIKEGVWSVLPARIPEFIKAIEAIKDEYHAVVGSDDVYNGLDAAIDAAKDLMSMSKAPEIPGFEGTKDALDDLFEAELFIHKMKVRSGIIK